MSIDGFIYAFGAVCVATYSVFGLFILGVLFSEWFLVTKRKGLILSYLWNREEFEEWLKDQPDWKKVKDSESDNG